MKKQIFLLFACIAFLIWAVDWLSRYDSTASSTDLTKASAAVQYAQAAKTNQEAAKIAQDVRRQNEMDDGIAINVNSRVIKHEGITSAEQLGSTISDVAISGCIFPWMILFGLFILWKKSKST